VTLRNGPLGESREEGSRAGAARPSRMKVLLVAMASLVLTLGAVFGRHGLLEARQFRLERDRLVAQNARLESENAAAEAEVTALRTQPLAVERLAREELSLARPGEIVILLAPPDIQREPLVSTTPGLDARRVAP
jgi:cell division protein FtsB